MQNVLSGTISIFQCSLSIGIAWKSSSSSECSRVLSGSWLPFELSVCIEVLCGSWSILELKDRCQHTGLVGICESLLGVEVTALQGVVCAGLKDAWSKLDT